MLTSCATCGRPFTGPNDGDNPTGECARCWVRRDNLNSAVAALGERYGFGAVMQAASEQWRERDPVGAIALGECYGVLEVKRQWRRQYGREWMRRKRAAARTDGPAAVPPAPAPVGVPAAAPPAAAAAPSARSEPEPC